MTDPNELSEVRDACGRAIGYALGAAFRLQSQLQLDTDEGLLTFAKSLNTLIEKDTFTEDTAEVLEALAYGLMVFVQDSNGLAKDVEIL